MYRPFSWVVFPNGIVLNIGESGMMILGKAGMEIRLKNQSDLSTGKVSLQQIARRVKSRIQSIYLVK